MSAALDRRAARALFVWASLVLLPALTQATTIRSVGVNDMLAGAELVFEGEVSSVDAFRSPGSDSVRTCVVFEVLEVIKGSTDNPLELCFSGGSAAGVTRNVVGLVYPKAGEHGIYFIESTTTDLVNPIYGWKQGHFVVAPDAEATVTTTDGNPVVRLDPVDGDRTTYTRDGVARGTVVQRSASGRSRATPGMGADQFKARLRELMAEGR